MVRDYETIFMELLQYVGHLNMKKLEIRKFVTELKSNFHAKVRI
jgi:hypothetical protein